MVILGFLRCRPAQKIVFEWLTLVVKRSILDGDIQGGAYELR